MHTPLAEQHRRYSSVLRGHYGYFGMPHNWRSLNEFHHEVRRIWFNCLKRRSQKNRRMGWDWFEALTARLPLPQPRITHPWARSEEHTSELQSLMRISYAVFCLQKKKTQTTTPI